MTIRLFTGLLAIAVSIASLAPGAVEARAGRRRSRRLHRALAFGPAVPLASRADVSPAGSEGIPSLPGVPPAASAQAAARVLESVTADEFTINRGETHGVREGDSYRVEGVDREVRDEGGRVIFRHTRLLGTAQVVEVRKEVSRLKLVQREEGKAAVKAGDMVSPLAAPSGPPAAGG